jgi:hypothetical protein
MELPDDVLAIIREYSKPRTRPNWREAKPIITTYKLYLVAKYKLNWPNTTHYDLLLANIRETEWYDSYITIQDGGLQAYYRNYYKKYGVKAPRINYVDGYYQALDISNQFWGWRDIFEYEEEIN